MPLVMQEAVIGRCCEIYSLEVNAKPATEDKSHFIIDVGRVTKSKNQIFSKLVVCSLQDDFIIVHVLNDYDSVLESAFKTEFLALLSTRYEVVMHRTLTVDISNNITVVVGKDKYDKIAGDGKRTPQFVKDNGDFPVLKPSRTALTISIDSGLPVNSRQGRHYGRASGSHQQQKGRARFAQPHANTSQTRGRRKSLSRYANVSQQGTHPNFPKSGAQRLAKQSSRGEIQADFKRTPDPGQSGNRRRSSTGRRKAPPPPRPGPTKPRPAPKPKLPQVKTLYPYDAQEAGELTFTAGAMISLLKEDPSGWWTGRLCGKEGMFPSNYVKKVA